MAVFKPAGEKDPLETPAPLQTPVVFCTIPIKLTGELVTHRLLILPVKAEVLK